MSFLSFSRGFLSSSIAVRGKCVTGVLVGKISRFNFATSSQLQAEEDSKYKRPVQPYLRFRSDYIAKFKAEHPELKLQDLNKLLSEEWAHLDPEIKGEYKRIYDEEMVEFKAPLKKIPRKPPGVFARFVKENFSKIHLENPNLKAQEIIRRLGDQWKEVPEEKKKELNKKLEEDTKRYEADVVGFEEKLNEEELDFLNHLAKDKMKKLHQQKLRLLNFPKKPGGPFLYFVNMEKDNFPRREDENMKEWLKRMGQRWRNLTDEEKESYLFVKKRAMEKYEEDVEEWKLKQQTKI
ncbi:transcription factor A, mitochondrial-like [Actinia tenebrosa]|uniref:Transcription factor A, mitochondrial-like n=1 Tax=Actinia tenebrosa TaxID=6105 RepID=A0A6P8I7K1_ACTTE|nr:transcription factor A, mitochondrial-like [Actinia tenebrosa]